MIRSLGNGAFELSGDLTFETVQENFEMGKKLFSDYSHLILDLTDVTRGDSAGLALLIEWLRFAKQQKKSLKFTHLPRQLLMIAKVSSLDILINHG